MRTHVLETEQWLPRPLDEVFPFFADAFNLQAITPHWLRFEVLSQPPIIMRAGTQIDYRLRWRGVPLRWRSCITVWDPPYRFVDEQARGPFRRWAHEHQLTAIEGGTLMRDRVAYSVPGGDLVQKMIVGRDVAAIFAHRSRVLRRIFSVGHVERSQAQAHSLQQALKRAESRRAILASGRAQ